MAMNSRIIQVCKKVRREVDALYESIDSPECSDKIAELDKTIEVVKAHIKPLHSDNASWKVLESFSGVVDSLKAAKSALASEETGDYKTKIWNARELIDHIQHKMI